MFNSNYNLLSYNWPRIILINSHTNQKSLGDLFKVFLANQHLSECVCVWMCVSGGMCQCVCVRVLWCSVSVCVKMGVYVEGLCMNVCIVCVWMCGVWVCALIGVTGCAWVWGRCVCVCVYACVSVCVPGIPTPPAFPPSSLGAPGSSVAAMRCTNSGLGASPHPVLPASSPAPVYSQMGNP